TWATLKEAGDYGIPLPAEIAQQLSAAGIDAAQIVREASAAGVSAALHNAGYLLAALMTLALLVSLRLPRTAAAPAAGEAARSAAAVR
ncbi:MAG TPA: hypothetical protein PLZ50_03045, partial [Rubrivivax sp.]|nr:hypothetical protein [Rubrivivax sp.]